MTASDRTPRHASEPGRADRRRWVPFAAAATAAALTVAAVASAGGGSAGAAGSLPQAQSVGNFLDATLGGSTLDAVAKLQYAHAEAPGANGVQNPLNVTALNTINLPLTGALQLPRLLGITLGAVNQVAKADTNGSSYGGSGAVNNSGGVSVGGDNNAFPANATIDLSAAGIAGSSGDALAALGGAKVTVGAVSALASTPVGYGKPGSTQYQIANLSIDLNSPALGQLLGGVLSSLTGVLGQLASAAGAVTQTLTGCDLTSGTVPSTISLDNGTIVIDPATAGLSIDLEALLETLGLDLNNLPANTDLIDFLLAYLADPSGLAKGIEGVINGLVDPLEAKYEACKTVIQGLPAPLSTVLTTLLDTLISGQATLESTVNQLVSTLGSVGGSNPLAPLASLLKALVDIGVNVQPNGPAGPAGAAYVDPLAKTPKQGTPVVDGQTIERAIEVNVAAGAGSSLGGGSLPGLGSLPLTSVKGLNSIAKPQAVSPAATTGSTGLLTLALANAAAGPSAAPQTSTTSAPPPSSSAPPTGPPTGVPAGQGTHGGSPVLPVTFLLLALVFAAGGVVSYRMRGRLNQH